MGDPCSPTEFMWDGLGCRKEEGSTNSRIVFLKLSSSGLTGEISTYFAGLSQLQYLDLSGNELTGSVPDVLASMTHLQILDLSGNGLNGYVPRQLLERSAAGILTLRIDSKSESTSSSGPTVKWEKILRIIGILAAVIGGIGITYKVYKICTVEQHIDVNSGGVGSTNVAKTMVGKIQNIHIHCCECFGKSESPRESNV